jgi:O-antigen/teichoic acid export membrane protein
MDQVIEPRQAVVLPGAERNMRVNTVSLILSNLVTGVLGLAFWGVAGRLYPTHEVGIAAAILTSAIMLATLSILSIDTLYERFLPLAGTRAGPLLRNGFLVVCAAATLSSIGLIVFGPREELFSSGWSMAGFLVLVVVLAVYTLQDKATVGLGVARWAAAKNSFHAVVKLVALIVLVWTGSAVSIVSSWGVTAAVAAVVLLVMMRRRYRTDPLFLVPPTLPPAGQIWSYFWSSNGLTALWTIGPLVVPLIVLAQFGAEANAHFAVTWAIVNALYTMVHLIVSPYVSEVAANPNEVSRLSWRMVQMMGVVMVVGSIGIVAVGPTALSLVGAEYEAQGHGLLYLAAIFVPLSAVGAVFEGFARVQRKLGLIIAVRCLSTFLIVAGSVIGTRSIGIIGVGWAYVVAEGAAAAILIVPTIMWLRRTGRESERAAIARRVAEEPVL